MDIICDALKIDMREYAPPYLMKYTIVTQWVAIYSSINRNPKKWKLGILANAIFQFNDVLKNMLL